MGTLTTLHWEKADVNQSEVGSTSVFLRVVPQGDSQTSGF